MQPVIVDKNGTPRFKENIVVTKLLEQSSKRGFGLNELVFLNLPQDDLEQFYQLIGYSVGGYCELSRVGDKSCEEAVEKVKGLGFPWQQGIDAVNEWKKQNGYPTG